MAIAVLGRDPDLVDALGDDVDAWARSAGVPIEVLRGDDPAALVTEITSERSRGVLVPLAFVELHRPDDWGQRAAITLQHDPTTAPTRTVLVTSKVSLHGVDDALKAGAVQGMLTRPWTRHGLARVLATHVATYLVEHAPTRLDEFDALFDEHDRALAHERVTQRARAAPTTPDAVHPLLDENVDDRRLEADLVRLLDETLGHPPRLRVSPGTILIEEGEDVGGFYVILDGSVRLSSHTETGERILHERSTGAIVGLLSLATRRRALQQCRAVTEVRAIPITLDQLARALDAAPELAGLLTRVLVSSLARRLRRSDQLQVELDQSLAELREARAQLVASARFATLGEMSAGLAHELNNPTAALARAVDHLLDDVATVVDDPVLDNALRDSYATPPPTAAEKRERRRTVARAVGDRGRAERLVAAGAADAAEAARLATLSGHELDRRAAAVHLGELLRNVNEATGRIQALVASLRAYARGDDGKGPLVDGVDVVGGIHDALALLSHRLAGIDVDVIADPVPAITARPGALQQVWTNLVANAADAMDGTGRLRIEVAVAVGAEGAEPAVEVRVHDDGPGIPPDLLPRIFEPRFTTKAGTVRYGLGLGLTISRQIVADHGGTLTVESSPGDTTFTVRLPVGGPVADEVGGHRRGRGGSGSPAGGARGAHDG